MEVMLKSWLEMASKFWGAGAGDLVEELVMLESGGSIRCGGMVIVCKAIMVEEGGVFSPSIDLCCDRADGRSAGVSLNTSRPEGVGVPVREGLWATPK